LEKIIGIQKHAGKVIKTLIGMKEGGEGHFSHLALFGSDFVGWILIKM
jgi:hypothetical protein